MAPLSPQLGARVVDAVPEAFRPCWLRETWSGSFGARGLVARVDDASSTLTLGVDWVAGTGEAAGEVFEEATRGGGFKRVVDLDRNGRLVVTHEKLKLDEGFQKTGFARAFNERAYGRYSAAGVDEVKVHADLEVGGYAWAEDFEIATPGLTGTAALIDRGRQLRAFVVKAHESDRISTEAFEQVAARLVWNRELPPDALTSIRELRRLPIGRASLLEQAWDGVRFIDHDRPDLAARAIDDLSRELPDALVPAAIRDALATHAGTRTSSNAMTTLGLAGDDQLIAANAAFSLTLPDRRFGMAGIAADEGRLIATEKFPVADAALRRDLDAAWHALGIDEVHNTFA